MPLWEHLDDLRKVLIRSLIALFVGVCVTWSFAGEIVKFLEKPLLVLLANNDRIKQQTLVYTGLADPVLVYLKVSLIAAVGLTAPFLLYQLWTFVAPALYKNERRFVVPFVLFGSITFLSGLAFAYYFAMPLGYKFLLGFNTVDQPMINLTDYFNLTIKILMSMGLIFELPVLMVLLAKIGFLNVKMLTKYRRHAVVLSSIVAAIVTPSPDAFTMIMTMIPLYLLYELGILAIRIAVKPEKKS
jgi:sec-independent protein translocase protein TatC